MTAESPPLAELSEAHIDAAVRALLAMKESGPPADAYMTMACIVVYLEAVLKLDWQQSFDLMTQAYQAIRADQKVTAIVLRLMREKMTERRVIVPGRMN